MPINIFLYIGIFFIVIDFMNWIPLKKIYFNKITQLIILFIINISLIITIPNLNILLNIFVAVITFVFTLLPHCLNIKLNKIIFTRQYINSNIPKILYYLNWDKYTKSKINIQKTYNQLLNISKRDANVDLNLILNVDEDLKKDNYWHQDVIQLLLKTRNFYKAINYIESNNIELSNPNLPYGLVYAMTLIYSEYGNFEKAAKCINYINKYFNDIQHHSINLKLYLIFYAMGGCEENFNELIENNNELRNYSLLPYWRAILMLKKDNREVAFMLLKNLTQKISHKEGGSLVAQIKYLMANPNLHKPATEVEKHIARETIPPDNNPKSNNIFDHLSESNRKKPIGTIILCCVVVVTTIIGFLLLSSSNFMDILIIKATPYDFIRIGGFNPDLIINNNQFVRFFTSILLHADWLHLAFNIYALFILSNFIEKILGKFSLYFIFFFSGFIGNLFSLIFNNDAIVGVGASGGVFGILAAFIVYVLWNRKNFNPNIFKRLIFNFIIIIGINIIFGLTNRQINNFAHLGGAIGGAFITFLYLKIYQICYNIKNIHKKVNIISLILSMSIFIYTIIFWYPLLNYNYFDNIELSESKERLGYTFKIPEKWSLIKNEQAGSEMIVDLYTSTQMYITKNPISNVYTNNKLKEELEILVGKLKKENTKIKDTVTELDNGWYYYSIELWSEELNKNYYSYTYYKVFPYSICNVIRLELKDTPSEFDNLFNKFLFSIEENS